MEIPIEVSVPGSGNWRTELLDAKLWRADGAEVQYSGEVLTASSQKRHAIDCTAVTSPFRRAILNIPVVVSGAFVVQVAVDGREIYSQDQTAAFDGGRILHCVQVDLTSISERAARLRFRLVFLCDEAVNISILMGGHNGDHLLCIRQVWSAGYACWGVTFFVLAWGTLLGVVTAMVGAAETLRSHIPLYGLVATVALTFSVWLGLPNIVRVPIQRQMRSGYGACRRFPRIALGILVISFLSASAAAGTVLYGLNKRIAYTSAIRAQLDNMADDSRLREAFKLLPWRKEAAVLFEKHARGHRITGDMPGFRAYIRTFTRDPGIVAAVRRASTERPPFYLAGDSEVYRHDPVLWFANILPEGDQTKENTETIEALKYLDGSRNPDAKLYGLWLRIDLTRDREQRRSLVDQLSAVYDQNSKHLFSKELQQIILDLLGCYAITTGNGDEAIRRFRQELSLRMEAPGNSALLWLRPPEKLNLFHMFRACLLPEDEADAPLVNANKLLNRLSGFRAKFRQYTLDNPEYSRFRDLQAWRLGTIVGLDDNTFKKYVLETMLSNGWRF